MTVLMAVDINSVTSALTTLVNGLEGTQQDLATSGQEVMQKLGLIEVCLALLWCSFGGESIKALLQKCLVLAVWMTIVSDFHELAKSATKWLVSQAGKVSGADDPWELVLNPSKIMTLGTKAVEPLLQKAVDVSLLDSVDVLMLAICALLLVFAFIFLAIHVAFAVIEFYLYLNLSALLLPFAVLQHTRFIADKAINAVLAAAIKLAVVTYIMSAIRPILESVELRNSFDVRFEDLTWNEIFSMLLVSMLCLFIAVAAPRMAAGLLHGSPSLSGTGVVLGAAAGAMWAGQAAAKGAWAMGQSIFGAAERGFDALGQHLTPMTPSAASPGGGGRPGAPPAPPPPPPVTYVFFGDQRRLGAPPRPVLEARGDDRAQLGRGGPLPFGSGGDAPRQLPAGGA